MLQLNDTKIAAARSATSRREVHRRRLHDDVARHLLEDIRRGRYTVGEGLPSERDLMEEFGVGRPAVREAMSKLQRMGLIDIRAGSRARVCKPSASSLLEEMGGLVQVMLTSSETRRDLQWLRGLFEAALARFAARVITDEALGQLEASLVQQREAVADIPRFAKLDLHFHRLIATTVGRELVLDLHQALSGWLLDQRMVTLRTEGQSLVALRAHEAIFEALHHRDADQAEIAMARHLQQIQELYQTQSEASS